jgi:hypothetical protein
VERKQLECIACAGLSGDKESLDIRAMNFFKIDRIGLGEGSLFCQPCHFDSKAKPSLFTFRHKLYHVHEEVQLIEPIGCPSSGLISCFFGASNDNSAVV